MASPTGHAGPAWTAKVAIFVLVAAAALLAVLSEILVSAIEPFIATFGLSAFFVGVVIIPTIGNLAEHLVAVQLAAKDKMEFAMAVTFGSSLQVALFVAPVLVLLGLVVGQPMNLVFTPLEIAAVAAAVGISSLIAIDGETNWLEGALLMLVYAILAVSFFEFVGRSRRSLRRRAATARRGSRRRREGIARVRRPRSASGSARRLHRPRRRSCRGRTPLPRSARWPRLAERLRLGGERIGRLLRLVVLLACRPDSISTCEATISVFQWRAPLSSSHDRVWRRPSMATCWPLPR